MISRAAAVLALVLAAAAGLSGCSGYHVAAKPSAYRLPEAPCDLLDFTAVRKAVGDAPVEADSSKAVSAAGPLPERTCSLTISGRSSIRFSVDLVVYADTNTAHYAYRMGDGVMNLPDITATGKLDSGYVEASDVDYYDVRSDDRETQLHVQDGSLVIVVSLAAETMSLSIATPADPLPLLDDIAGQAVNKLRTYSA